MQVCCTWENESPEYKETLNYLVRSLRERSLLPFFGAGISTDPPANLPLGVKLRKILIESLLNITKEHFSRDSGEEGRDTEWHGAEEILTKVMLEKIFGGIYDIFGDDALSFWQVLITENPNANHRAIANLCGNNLLSDVITLNFDILIEIALSDEKIPYKTICPIDDYSFPENIQNYQVTVIKPHGSLPLLESKEPKFKHIIATIQRIGNEPSEKNEAVIINLVKNKNMRNVLFAGYSDNDIDIFPIFLKHSPIFNHIFWFRYVSNNEMKNWVSESWKNELPDRLQQRFKDLGNRLTIVCGNLSDFFNRLLSHLSLRPISENIDRTLEPKINVDFLVNNPYKTALALAHLLENSGERQLSLKIFLALRKKQAFQSTPYLNAFLLSRLAWGYHAIGDLTSAFSSRKEAIKVLLNNDTVSNVNIEIGYEYWSFVKKTINPKTITSIYKIPWFLFQGWRYFEKAKHCSKSSEHNTWIIPFYYGDLLHYFARFTILISGRVDMLTSLLLNRARFYYKNALVKRNLTNSLADFYKMRYVETQIVMGRIKNLEGLAKDIEDAIYTYEIIQDDIQIGYSEVIRALVCYCKHDRIGAMEYIKKAKKQYELPHSPYLKESREYAERPNENPTPHLSGLMEVVCYERFFGLKSLSQSINCLLKLIRQHKLIN